MTDASDMDLVREFGRNHSEAAFTELVERHLKLVYSVARRCTDNDSDAQDVTQAVFVILARKAAGLRPRTVLTGWLYETTRHTAACVQRTNIRRHLREQEAYMQSTLTEAADTAADWCRLAPHLEAAMSQLGESDRTLLALRFYENKTGPEAAVLLGIQEAAAHKRTARAVDKLRKFFTRRGIALSAAAIAGAVSTHSVQAAPAGLAKSVAVAKGAAAGGSTLTLIQGALKTMAWTKAKTAVIAAVIIVGVAGGGAGLYAYHTPHPDLAAELQAALHVTKPAAAGTWSYPSDQVAQAILRFGSNRAEAFPVLAQAVRGTDSEARQQAIAALGMIVRPKVTNIPAFLLENHLHPTQIPPHALDSLQGEPPTGAVPLLREILFADNEASSLALASLHDLFDAQDIPALADLLVRSHDPAKADQQLQRYLPEAIAITLQHNPETAAPFVTSVQDLLNHENPDIRFGAACALAKYQGVQDPKISAELAAGLGSQHDDSRFYPDTEGLKHLMAVETLQRLGPGAKPLLPALLTYAQSTKEHLMRELAFRAAGHIDTDLRNTMPEVDQALKNDPDQAPLVPPQ